MPKQPCVYILASNCNGTLYICVTSDLFVRVGLYKQDLIAGFTKRYGVHRWSITRCTRQCRQRSRARSV
jgi:putative endonuclease